MKELKQDLFSLILEPGINAVCITTNGQYTSDGLACMGGGCAGECARRWPQTAVRLGKCLINHGTNVPFVIGALDHQGNYVEPNLKLIREEKFKCLIFSFPTIHNLADGANLELIKQSAAELVVYVNRFQLRGIAIGRPGCGIGGLSYKDQVRPLLQELLDDRFTIVSFNDEE